MSDLYTTGEKSKKVRFGGIDEDTVEKIKN